MTLSSRAIEAALDAFNGCKSSNDIDAMQDALSVALAVDGLALQGWQPIESAPENENVLICGYGPAGYYVADAKKINGCWMLFDPPCDTHSYESYGHSHWQPLPPPPAASDRT